MADEDEQEIVIPKEFSLRELHQEAQNTLTSRKDWIEKRLQSGKAVAPSKNLALYSIARLEAIVRLLAQLHNEEIRKARAEKDAPEEETVEPGRVVPEDF